MWAQVVRMRFTHTALVASLVGGLSGYQEGLGVAVVDCVLEEMRWGLDHPAAGGAAGEGGEGAAERRAVLAVAQQQQRSVPVRSVGAGWAKQAGWCLV